MQVNTEKKDLSFIIIGAGMAGMLAAIKLREAGYSKIAVYEKAATVGGTWRENTYPGLNCDVPAHTYTYSFEPNANWNSYLASGGEIQQYFESVREKYQLNELIHFNQEVVRAEFIDQQWQLQLASGEALSADIVIGATGVLHHPKQPNIAGRDEFKGQIFHSAQWDHSATLDGKRIGVVGSGSTGVQIISALADRAGKLCHFQRSSQWIMPVENPKFSEAQKQAFRDDPELLAEAQYDAELQANIERFSEAIVNPGSEVMQQIQMAVQANLDMNVLDKQLKQKLTPDDKAGCKRLVYSPDYYQAIQHPNAQLVDDGIECIEADGIRTKDGVLHELDVIVLATGFHADRFMRPMHVSGLDGVRLNDVWADGPGAYLAVAIPQFPNFFMLNGPNGPVGNFSLIDIAEHQWHYISQLIEQVATGRCTHIAPSQSAMDSFEVERVAAAKTTIFGSGCKSWYLDKNGVPATWPWTRQAFYKAMEKPELSNFELCD